MATSGTTNELKTTIGSDHKRAMEALLAGLKKLVDEATKKNADDENAKALAQRYEKLKDSVEALKPSFTQMDVYEGLKTRMKTASTDFPKLVKAVKKPGEDEEKVEYTFKYANSKVEKACKADKRCAGRIGEVLNHGPDYKGHKAVSALKATGHVHVGNDNGIAFKWSKTELTIVGYGTKSDAAKPGNSGYEWIV